MGEYKLGEMESIFADIIWQQEPLSSRMLSELAEQRLNWKRTTTYTSGCATGGCFRTAAVR